MRKYKIFLMICDGLGDIPSKTLDFKTPLEMAYKPNIDSIAGKSTLGLMYPIAPGIRPGSDTSHLAIFGYDPNSEYPGRGVFEALGSGAELEEGDIAFRGNFATVDEDLRVIDRRAGRRLDEGDQLVRLLNEEIKEIDGVKVLFFRGTEHRVSVVLRGKNLSSEVSDTDPHVEGEKVKLSLAKTNEGIKTAEIVNKLTKQLYRVLSSCEINRKRREMDLPEANIVLLRGASKMRKFDSFNTRTGLTPLLISATAIIKGVGKALGIPVVTPEGATGTINTNYKSKITEAIKGLEKFDIVIVHYKATDNASHDKNPISKVKVIENIDKAFGILLDKYGEELTITITGDHTTSSDIGEHMAHPVPFLIYSPIIFKDNIRKFSERDARQGSLRLMGKDVINLLLDASNRAILFGA